MKIWRKVNNTNDETENLMLPRIRKNKERF